MRVIEAVQLRRSRYAWPVQVASKSKLTVRNVVLNGFLSWVVYEFFFSHVLANNCAVYSENIRQTLPYLYYVS